jgi:hypothetical protein
MHSSEMLVHVPNTRYYIQKMATFITTVVRTLNPTRGAANCLVNVTVVKQCLLTVSCQTVNT